MQQAALLSVCLVDVTDDIWSLIFIAETVRTIVSLTTVAGMGGLMFVTSVFKWVMCKDSAETMKLSQTFHL